MQLCVCGGYPVAICTQCQCPLCIRHANKLDGNRYTNEYKKLQLFLDEFPNPVSHDGKIDVATPVSNKLMELYEDKHVCLSCHLKNVKCDADKIIKGLTWPEDKFDFILWLLLDKPPCIFIPAGGKDVGVPPGKFTWGAGGDGVPLMTNGELVRGWLQFAQTANIPPDKLLPQTETLEVPLSGANLTEKLWSLGGKKKILRKQMRQVPAWHISPMKGYKWTNGEFIHWVDCDGYITAEGQAYLDYSSGGTVYTNRPFELVSLEECNELTTGIVGRISRHAASQNPAS
jgi:hypothetical protein